jgi:transcriptional regulator with XRE-family HTH domain
MASPVSKECINMPADKAVIGARLRAEREERGWSREALAARLRSASEKELPGVVNLAHMIKEWEAGKHGVSDRYRLLYCRVFGMAEAGLFEAAGPREPAEQPPAFTLRDLNGQPIDAGHVHSIRETNQALVRLDTLYGGNDIFPLALRIFRTAHSKLAAGAYVPTVERDLTAATGEAGEIAAWLAYDADRQATSRHIIHEALMLSRQAGDRDMELFQLGHLAMQSIHLRRSAEGLRIASDALDRRNLAPRVAALFEIRRGRALAQLGDEAGAFGALDKARSALLEGICPRDPYWTWWVNDTELARHKAMAHTHLGHWEQAVPLYEHVVSRREPGYLDRTLLLEALIHVRDWREAEPLLSELAEQTGEIASIRTTNLLRRVVHRLGRTKTPSTIADRAENLRRALGEEPTGEPGGALL